jgi:hypothetical protein
MGPATCRPSRRRAVDFISGVGLSSQVNTVRSREQKLCPQSAAPHPSRERAAPTDGTILVGKTRLHDAGIAADAGVVSGQASVRPPTC